MNLTTDQCRALTEAFRTEGGKLFLSWLSNNFDKTMRELLSTDVDKVESTRGRAKSLQDILKFIQDADQAFRQG